MAEELKVADLLKVRLRQLLFAPLGKEQALGTAQQGLVVLDPRSRTPLARNLLHELIHVKRPLWSEPKVLREESRLWNSATWREKGELFRLLGKAKIWEGEEDFEDKFEVQSGSKTKGHSTSLAWTPWSPRVMMGPIRRGVITTLAEHSTSAQSTQLELFPELANPLKSDSAPSGLTSSLKTSEESMSTSILSGINAARQSVNNLYWLAGILEGEGSFGMHTIKKRPTARSTQVVQLKMTDADVMYRVSKLLNCRQYCYRRPGKYKTVWSIKLSGKYAVGLMMTMYCLLGSRRQERIRQILTYWKQTPNKGHAGPAEHWSPLWGVTC